MVILSTIYYGSNCWHLSTHLSLRLSHQRTTHSFLVIMKYAFTSIALLTLLNQSVIQAQEAANNCSQASVNWGYCQVANIASCSTCFPGTPDLTATCSDYKSAFCPFTQCCTECADTALIFAQCTVDNLTDLAQSSACDLDCSSFVPEENTANNTDCSQASLNWGNCQVANIASCRTCFPGTPDLTATCSDYKSAFLLNYP